MVYKSAKIRKYTNKIGYMMSTIEWNELQIEKIRLTRRILLTTTCHGSIVDSGSNARRLHAESAFKVMK